MFAAMQSADYAPVEPIPEPSIVSLKTINEFRKRLWGAAQRLFDGGSRGDFTGTFARSIDVQLTEAWNKGAESVGVEPDEMTEDDLAILEAIINNENHFIRGISWDIVQAREEGLEQEAFASKFGARVDLWANRYNEVVNRARMQFGSKVRLKWVYGMTEDHCDQCRDLNGIVAFGREWQAARLHPQMPPNNLLGCEGWGCECQLVPTTERRTSRAMDRLTHIAMMKAG